MSGAFSGFSEDDIKKVQNGLAVEKPVDIAKSVIRIPKTNKPTKPMIKNDVFRNKINNVENIDIPIEAKLSKPQITALPEIDTNSIKNEEPIKEESKKEEQNKNDTETQLEKNYVDLDEFQARQKLIEEQNRQRKQILTKALADKKKRTQEEAERLNEIQNEFKKLDALLSNDVKLLRKKIEIASIDYMEAQKKYIRIETEFLDAKLALQQKLEKKELLTEHLCTIIEQNEQRKAEKLMELLNKLEVADVTESETK